MAAATAEDCDWAVPGLMLGFRPRYSWLQGFAFGVRKEFPPPSQISMDWEDLLFSVPGGMDLLYAPEVPVK